MKHTVLRLCGKVVISLVALFITVLFLEGATRLLFFVSPTRFAAFDIRGLVQISDNEDLSWELRPGAIKNISGIQYVINSFGFRDHEFDVHKPPSVFRILALGDSVTFGHGIPQIDETYPKVLERLLQAQYGRGVEVLNGGVGGYNTRQEYLFLLEKGLLLNPDLLILGVVMNDGQEAQRFDGIMYNRRYPWVRWIRQYSYFLTFVEHRFHLLPIWLRLRKKPIYYYEDVKGLVDLNRPERETEAFQRMKSYLTKIAATAKEHDTGLIVVVFPAQNQLTTYSRARAVSLDIIRAPQKKIAHWAKDHDVPLIDLLPSYDDEHKQSKKLLYTDDFSSHPNRRGHAIAARQLFRLIEKLGLIPSSRDT